MLLASLYIGLKHPTNDTRGSLCLNCLWNVVCGGALLFSWGSEICVCPRQKVPAYLTGLRKHLGDSATNELHGGSHFASAFTITGPIDCVPRDFTGKALAS